MNKGSLNFPFAQSFFIFSFEVSLGKRKLFDKSSTIQYISYSFYCQAKPYLELKMSRFHAFPIHILIFDEILQP